MRHAAARREATGSTLGRFVLLDESAAVFTAYDPDLDRKVSLKLLHGELDRREAQALARLDHPNVVAVHEVDFVANPPYAVLEHLDGTELRAWLAEKRRGWREILAVLRAAGEGLAAAHRAGVVHRDFGAGSVLVGRDDRPRVHGFGLADDGLADARTDQRAFCATAWRALHGERPAADPAIPRPRRAPAYVYRALARGLASDPAARWPDMGALLAALGPRRVAGPFVAALAVAAVIGAALLLRTGAADRCVGVEADGWSSSRREAVRAAFAATGLPFQADTWHAVSAQLDDYAARWRRAYATACDDERRRACLDRRHDVLAGLTSLWAGGVDARGLESALDAAQGLPGLEGCLDSREPPPPPSDPIRLAQLERARGHLASTEALWLAGQVGRARAEAMRARAEADASGWIQVRAEAALAEGRILAQSGDAEAEPRLLEAARLAADARDDRLGAAALVELVGSLTLGRGEPERALEVADLAEASLARLGDEPRLATQLLRHRAEAALHRGRLDEAEALLRVARARALTLHGPRDWESIAPLGLLVRVADGRRDWVEARRVAEQSLAATTALLGPEHPRTATALNYLGLVLEHSGDLAGAASAYRRSLAIKERTLGPASSALASTKGNLGWVEVELGHLEAGEALIASAIALRERDLGPDHEYVGNLLNDLGIVKRRRGQLDESLTVLRRALSIKLRVYGPDHEMTACTHEELALTLEALGQREDARAHQRRVEEIRGH